MSRSLVLLVLDRPVAAQELAGVAQDLAAHPRLRAGVVLAGQPLPPPLRGLAEQDLHVLDGGPGGRDGAPAGTSAGGRAGLRARLLSTAVGQALATGLRQHRLRSRARTLMDATQPAVLLVSDDRALGQELALLHEARRRRVPVVLLGIAAADARADAVVRRGSGRHRAGGLSGRLLARLAPHQLQPDGQHRLLFYPPLVVVVLALLRQLPARPWVLGGSGPDVVAGFERQPPPGLTGTRYAPVGQPSLVGLGAPGAREAARSRLGLRDDQTVVCCALPHLGEHGLLGWTDHDEEARWLLGSLAACGAQVVVSLHPRADPVRYRQLVQACGATLLEESLHHALPAADVFVATVSSTLRWAALLGIPSVVVDHQGLGHDPLPGQVHSRRREDLAPALSALCDDAAHRAEAGRALRAAAESRYVALDGRAGERLLGLVAELAEEASSCTT